ncbi:TetR/AcrR family transcriptional regulator [Sphingobium phenoxybenzoativorans]|uniref:TetR/AcrR family transcriptional regulator n=1 Tax=Sphingobium phenoxybenzoativorans TaxID=1592790 RepID=A0A975K2T0_9SPHN|nr:TetR/AcrR family transcriptional regulator [Sphingobium phenoxybenzoativorans]QUT03870.1 TetR/AcrR family transcriptional regulator [Sphingobium phenoxybenzoativorans]
MNRPAPSLLKPRKAPQQARSAATIEAIHIATIQVLLAGGVGRLTTTRVAERAGVSVGTMYQYYPHKQALLFALVERQFDLIESAMQAAAERLMGCDLQTIAAGLATAWLDAKMADRVASRAIYGIAAEFDLSELMSRAASCMAQMIDALLANAPGAHFADRASVAFMLAALLGGSVRVVMEAEASEDNFTRLRRELPQACHAYLAAANQMAAAQSQ